MDRRDFLKSAAALAAAPAVLAQKAQRHHRRWP